MNRSTFEPLPTPAIASSTQPMTMQRMRASSAKRLPLTSARSPAITERDRDGHDDPHDEPNELADDPHGRTIGSARRRSAAAGAVGSSSWRT